jgi:hypothetical protein
MFIYEKGTKMKIIAIAQRLRDAVLNDFLKIK